MGKTNAHIFGFATGEISRAAMARIDQERVRLAAEIQENLFPHTIGEGLVRPGTEYLANTASNNRVRLIPFIKGVTEKALLEFTNAKLRVLVDDVLVTRAAVTSTVTNGDFSSSTGWTLTTTGSATANINSTVSGALYMACGIRGGTAVCERSVSTSTAGTEHALRIVVTRGPVVFRCGSSSGADDYISETELDTGEHSLAFTPSGTYYVRFYTKRQLAVIVDSITVESAGVMELSAPWATADLREIRIDQSGDIVFLAHEAWRQRKIERRGETSWSLAHYITDDGPFTTGPTAQVGLKPTVLEGNTTLAADRPFFTTAHVGALFRLFYLGQKLSAALGAGAATTETFKVTGVGTDRTFSYAISGTFVGTVTTQRSFEGPDSGFNDAGSYSAPTSSTVNDGLDNVDVWYRYQVTAYTSGSINVDTSYGGGGTWGTCRVTAFSSSTSVAVEVLQPFPNNQYFTTVWQEGEWSDARGWPTAVSFFDGRLWWGREDQFWGSESDSYYAFNLETEGDAGSIQRSIATGGVVNTVNWMLPLQRLIFGTDGSEASARASSFDQPLTPTNLTLKDASTQGVAPISPAKLDGRGIYVQRSGRQVYEVLYSVDRQDYISNCLTKFNRRIGGDGFYEVAVQRQPESYLWFVRADGVCPVLLYDPGEQVSAWFKFIGAPSLAGDAVVESVTVLPDDGQDAVYLAVKRTINGSTVRFIEKLTQHVDALGDTITTMADAGVFEEGPVTSVTAAHLANETGLVGWGTTGGVSGPITGLSANGSGVIALGGTYTDVFVGLAYEWRYKSSKLAYAAHGGTALLQRKRVGPVGLLAANISMHEDAIQFGPDFDSLQPMPRTRKGAAVDPAEILDELDEPAFPFKGGWDTDSRLCMAGAAPYPATLLGLVVGVETHG